MNEEQYQKRGDVAKRLQRTRKDETICLAYWEVKVVLDWLKELTAQLEAAKASHEKVLDILKAERK